MSTVNSNIEEPEVLASESGITFSGLDPILGSLGQLINLLTSQGTDTYELNGDWFLDPITNIENGVKQNPQEFQSLLGQILGQVGGNALGAPVSNPGVLGTWYPIKYKDQETGLYLVSYTKKDETDHQEYTVIGVGALHTWKIPPTGTELLQADVYALVPFVRIGNGGFGVTFTEKGYPIMLGVAVTGPEGENLIDVGGVSFNGVKANASIDFAASPHFGMSLEIVSLMLPGDSKPSNRTLADLEAISADQILETAASLFVGALSKVFPQQETRIDFFAPLFGLKQDTPIEGSDVKIPILEWYDLFKAATGPSTQYPNGALTPFLDWFSQITSTPSVFKTWLQCLSGFLGGSQENINITGSGTRTDPFAVSLIEVGGIGTLNFTGASTTVNEGELYFYPGLEFSGDAIGVPDSSSDYVFIPEANLELGEFSLSQKPPSTPPDTETGFGINFIFKFIFRNKTEGTALASWQVSSDTYSLGRIEGGMSLGLKGNVIPQFYLYDVVTGASKFASVDLLSPTQLANAGAATLSNALTTLLGVGGASKEFTDNVAALIGLVNPPAAGTNWPEQDLVPPFSPKGMATSITDPIGQWGKYYHDVLTYSSDVDGKKAFTYLVESFGKMLQLASDSSSVSASGNGTPADPWKAGISTASGLNANVIAYTETLTNGDLRLYMGLQLAPEITLGSLTILPSVNFLALSLDFPASGSISGQWLPLVLVELTIPNAYTTPYLAGLAMKIGPSQLSAGWSRFNGWGWSMYVNDPTLEIKGGNSIPLNQDLNFQSPADLAALITGENAVQNFGPFLTAALGAFLLRTQTRAGLFATGALGMVTDISTSPNFPTGLSWQGFDQFKFTSFQNPFPDIRTQLASNFSSEAKAQSMLALLAWTINTSLTKAPAISGTGAYTDPYITPIPLGFNLPVWYTSSNEVLGLGIGRNDSFSYPSGVSESEVKFQFDLQSQLSLIEYSLQEGKIDNLNNLPAFAFLGTLSNPNGPLVDLPANLGTVKKVVLGFVLSVKDGAIDFAPQITLIDATLPGNTPNIDITLEEYINNLEENVRASFQAVLNAAIQAAVDQVKEIEGFDTAYTLLSLMGLTLTRPEVTDPYGINSAGFNGLLSNFNSYIRNQLVSVLTVEADRKILYNFLQETFHVTIPTFPTQFLDVMSALGICGLPEQGYPLEPLAVLEILSDPINSLKARFEALFSNDELLQALTRELVQSIPAAKYGNFTFSSNTNGVITIEVLPADSFNLGSFINFSGAVAIDLINKRLTATLNAFNPTLGLSLQDILTLNLAGSGVTADLEIDIVWGDGNKPAAKPLQIVPFDQTTFLHQLSELAPVYILNVLLNAGIEDQLLSKYPFVQEVFKSLGLAQKVDEGFEMSSILGILSDPLGWMLSDAVLGDGNGRFDLSKFVTMLTNLPEVSTESGIKVTPDTSTDSVAITGLPYDFSVTLSGANNLATFTFATESLSLAGGYGELDNLNFGVSLNTDYQPAFTGGVKLTSPKLNLPFAVSVGYKEEDFLLSIAQTQPNGVGIQLLPFSGWGQLAAHSALFAVNFLKEQMPEILNSISKGGASDFVTKMEAFATAVDVGTLVDNIINTLVTGTQDGKDIPTLLDEVEQDAFNWLKGLFADESSANNTANAIKALLSDILVDQLTVNKGELVFQPSAKVPVQILAGLNSSGYLGLWAGITEIPNLEVIKVQVIPTGIGVNVNDLTDFAFSFGLSLVLPIESQNGPGLCLTFDSGKFKLEFNPMADPAKIDDGGNPCDTGEGDAPLKVELLPDFFGGQDITEAVEAWLLAVVKDVLPRYISLLVLNQSSVKTWLQNPVINVASGPAAPTPADILLAAQLIINTAGNGEPEVYALNSFSKLAELTPKGFLGNFIQKLMENPLTLFTFGSSQDSSIIIGPDSTTAGNYGLLLQAPDLQLNAIPNLVIQLGAKDDEWISKSGGPSGEPGLGFYVPLTGSANNWEVDFTSLDFVLYNVGFDFVGTNGTPLVNQSRFKIGSVGPRVLFKMDFNEGSPTVTLGAAIDLDDIAISVAPNKLTEGSGGNPIAANLMGSGGDKSTDNPPANPSFSAQVAYTEELYVNLQSNTGNGSEILLPIQRAFGPLYVDTLGLGWEEKAKLLDFLFTGSVQLAGLQASLIGLTVGVPVTNPTDFSSYELDLQGIDITYKGGSVSLNAGFLKSENPLQYVGTAIVKAGKYTIGALGAYAEIEDKSGEKVPSIFIFGTLSAPLGGVPAFFVTGVAAGISYNRSLKIPSIDDVQSFPLVSGLSDGSFTEGEKPGEALEKLVDVVQPEIGQYWLAAGLKFTSFELINSSALLFISFGRDFEVNLLGLSYASLPPMVAQNEALAYFELALKVSFRPEDGVISAQAQLTPNSFVLSKDCKVTGGFAFFLWYKTIPYNDSVTIPAGDFVISLGGYHPAFQKPVYYPEVPRLGMSWKMDISVGKISIGGFAYFALCPTAVMAGGYLGVTYELGPLKAWMKAYANFLIEWQPFYFDVGIGVSIGASFGTKVAGVSITLKAELGATLQLQGPPTHGHVHVDWYVISFTIPIGSGDNATSNDNLDWAAFEQNFLPAAKKEEQSQGGETLLAESTPTEVQQVVKWNAESGLEQQNSDDGLWTVQPIPFSVSVNSAIPSNHLTVSLSDFDETSSASIGVRPMGFNGNLDSPIIASILNESGEPVQISEGMTLTVVTNGAPSALWSQDVLNKSVAPDSATMIIPGAYYGINIAATDYLASGLVGPFAIKNLEFDLNPTKDLPFSVIIPYPASDPVQMPPGAYTQIQQSIMDPDVIKARNEIYSALEASSIEAPASPDLSVMSTSAAIVLQAPPVLAGVDIYQNGGVPELGTTHTAAIRPQMAQTVIKEPKAPVLKAFMRRHKAPATASTSRLPGYRANANSRWVVLPGIVAKSRGAKMYNSIPAPQFKTLYDGGIAIWSVDDTESQSITYEGDLNLSVGCFKSNGALILLTQLNGSGTYQLPDGTAELVVQVFGSVPGETIGWQSDTVLSKLGYTWTAGDACLIRMQNAQRISASNGFEIGLIGANELLAKNQITTLNEQKVGGWLQTLFPKGSEGIGVLVDNADISASDALSIGIENGEIPVKFGNATMNKQVSVEGMTLFIYDAPTGDGTYDAAILKALQPDAPIVGVYGLSDVSSINASNALEKLKLRYPSLDINENQHYKTQIKVTSNQ